MIKKGLLINKISGKAHISRGFHWDEQIATKGRFNGSRSPNNWQGSSALAKTGYGRKPLSFYRIWFRPREPVTQLLYQQFGAGSLAIAYL